MKTWIKATGEDAVEEASFGDIASSGARRYGRLRTALDAVGHAMAWQVQS